MKNTIIDDAIFTASPEIIKHRYNPILGILLTVASIYMLWANSNLEWFEYHELASQWNLLISSCMLCTGVTMICYCFFGDSLAPMDKKRRERLYRWEYAIENQDLSKVTAAVETGDFTLIKNLPRCYQGTSQLICYRTDSGSLIAAQVVSQHQPVSEIKVFREGEYAF